MSELPSRQPKAPSNQSETLWTRYLQNVGTWTGERSIIRPSGEVLFVLPTRVEATVRQRPSYNNDYVRWDVSVKTGDGIEKEVVEVDRGEIEAGAAVAADGSCSLGPIVESGSGFKVQNMIVCGNGRVCCEFAYGWEGGLQGLLVTRENRVENEKEVVESIVPPAWKSSSILLDYLVGRWKGGGVVVSAKGAGVRSVKSWVGFDVGAGLVMQTSGVEFEGARRRPSTIRAKGTVDGNLLMFPEDGVQIILAPGGVSVSCPTRIGQAWAVETAWLVQPDERRRVIRCYGRDGWLNTLFLKERRVG